MRISQVLSNLVNNALKFTDHGHVVVGVSMKSPAAEEGGECVIEFSVSDTGVKNAKRRRYGLDVREFMRGAFSHLPFLIARIDKAQILLTVVVKAKRSHFG